MLDIAKLLATYDVLKAHENEIMAKRPERDPRAAWRISNPAPVAASFRVVKDSKSFMAHIIYDTVPSLMIYTFASTPKIVARISLRDDDAAAQLEPYSLPAPGDMVNFEFAAIRDKLGLTQQQLAPLLELGSHYRVSEYGRETNPKSVPGNIARLMRAYESGYRPADWPA